MSIGMIFVFLLVGAIVGFEFGKYMTAKKVEQAIREITNAMQKEAEAARKKKEEARATFNKSIDELCATFAKTFEKKKVEQSEKTEENSK